MYRTGTKASTQSRSGVSSDRKVAFHNGEPVEDSAGPPWKVNDDRLSRTGRAPGGSSANRRRDYQVLQIKEKFGTLRFYLAWQYDELGKAAEAEADLRAMRKSRPPPDQELVATHGL